MLRDQQDTEITLDDFGIGMMAGLVRAGHNTLDERRLEDVHEAFCDAYQVIAQDHDRDELRFILNVHPVYRTTPDVFNLMNYWLKSDYATRDAPGTIYRFKMSQWAANEVLKTLLGGAELYDRATDAFLKHMGYYRHRRT